MLKFFAARLWMASVLLLMMFASAGQTHADRLPTAVQDTDYHADDDYPVAQFELGRLLFFDKILSGNFNISCASCHHALTDTGDGLSLPVGEGGTGLGVTRTTGFGSDAVHERVPRNAPPVFNLGAREFHTLFADGRVAVDPSQPRGFLSPAGDQLPAGLDNVLAVQALFPVTSATEMAGQAGENPVADVAAAGDLVGVWEQLAHRLREIPAYVELFKAAYHEIRYPDEITFVHAANAIAAFEASAWRQDQSPFDRYLRGNRDAMSPSAVRGMRLFYGRAGCSGCHSGAFQTDHRFYAIAIPQIGPGKNDGASGREDFGRERVSGDPADRYRFRVPSLRNVALTGPWGHDGAFGTLDAAIRHHLDPVASLLAYDESQVALPSREDLNAIDFLAHWDKNIRAEIAAANELGSTRLHKRQLRALMDFLHALTDPASLDLRHDVPASVPSGLPVFE